MCENRRVVVTGLGAVTPVGNNVKDTWEGLKSGRNGIAPITLFDTSGYKAKLGAEVKGFDPGEYLEVFCARTAMPSLPWRRPARP